MREEITSGIRSVAAAAIIALASGVAMGDTFTDLAAFQGATQNLRNCNFDLGADGGEFSFLEEVAERYAVYGVHFPPGNFVSFTSGSSPPKGWFNRTSPDNGITRIFNANFDAGVTAVGVFQVLNSGGGGSYLTAFDAGGNVLGTAFGDDDLGTIDFFGLTTTTPIARITVTFTHNIEGYGADDLYFGEAIGGGCAADFNGDQQVDFFDYLDFASAFDAEDPSADFNGDNQVDFFDYLDFVAAFDGCQ
jgi:hypothetical protein